MADERGWQLSGKYTRAGLRRQQTEMPAFWLLHRVARSAVELLAQQALQTDAPEDTVYRLDVRLVAEPRKE